MEQTGFLLRHEAEILALWNEKMTPLGWLPVDTFSEEVCDMLVIWNEDDCEEQDFDLAQMWVICAFPKSSAGFPFNARGYLPSV
jgi:hypothetical protein